MKFLLDTHLLLWAAGSPRRLSAQARKLLGDTDHQLFFSSASLWEIAIKRGLGRDDFQVEPGLLRRGLLDNGYQELMLTFQERGKEEPTLLICDALLVAAGRRPNVTGMDLELAKVEYDIKKGLIVNDRLQTTNPKIFGVGD